MTVLLAREHSRVIEDLDLAERRCDGCDVRIEHVVEARLRYVDGQPEICAEVPSTGAFVRVFHRGHELSAATTALEDLGRLIEELTDRAEALPPVPAGELIRPWPNFGGRLTVRRGADLAALRARCEGWLPALAELPFVARWELDAAERYKIKSFGSKHGVCYVFDSLHRGSRFRYLLAEGERRFGHQVHAYDDLEDFAERIQADVEGSRAFLAAPPVEPGTYRVVLNNPVVGLFAHEAFGHKSEADFMLGDPAAIEAWRLGSRVASPALSIVDDGGFEATSGDCPWDDEGLPSDKTHLIKDGVLVGRLHSLRTAAALGERPTGNGRAMDFEHEPMVRMRTTYVEPGPHTFEELLALAGDGLYVETSAGGTGMSTFTMYAGKVHRIRGGKLAEPVRASVIEGSVFETLAAVEACSSDFELKSSMQGGCGKDHQFPLPVAMGGPKVLVGAMFVS